MAAALMVGWLVWDQVQQRSPGAVSVDPDDIGGVVTGAAGPEAGVWVIAETTDLGTRFIRIVVTDDRGRYVLPDLPEARYEVFVRGYGLVDSPRTRARPGQHLDLAAMAPPDARSAAQVYPANYWLSLASIPTGSLDEQQVVSAMKACMACHQIGDEAT